MGPEPELLKGRVQGGDWTTFQPVKMLQDKGRSPVGAQNEMLNCWGKLLRGKVLPKLKRSS